MVSSENKRIYVTVSKSTYDYLEKIVKIYNAELGKRKNRLLHNCYKLSVSSLYSLAIGNLVLQIDRQLDEKQTQEENYRKIFKMLCPSRKLICGK